MVEVIAKMVKKMAEFGAGATSALASYQPKTPACLMDDED